MENYEGKHSRQPSNKSSRTPSPARSPPRIPSNEDVYRAIPRTPPPPSRVGPPPSPPVPTRPIAPVAPEPPGPIALSPCSICGRTFVPQSLSKHVKICEKMLTKKRKTFDSSRQRREGTDLEQFLPKNFGLPENSPFLEKSPPNTAKIAPKVHKPSVKNAIKKPMAELQRCPHCSRAFGVRAFERHVEWCADKAKILPATPAPAQQQLTAKQRLNARTQYKAPLVRGRRSSQSRDKSSNSRSVSVESSREVSPPPPRDSGDYRRGRVRASESMSSNDFHEESPHVPVIKNTRGHMSGDANVKARQARLARDLSSSRIEDNYDPFASAARQMKELMSSESNLPKKVDNSLKNRTLPILRPSKDKTFPADNSKMIKDTLNKSYQKTPTLQRMKSFGSPANENNSSFGSRCSSFRMSKNNNNKSSQKLNTTFTKSSKENISSIDKTYFNRNSNLNRSFSSYTTSNYNTPKLKEKIPKITTSLYHSFQRNTIKQPVKLDKIKIEEPKKDFVNLDVILTNDNTSMTDSNYIDPRLINENDNLPINVTTILNNPDIISSMESLLTTENLPSKFDSFSNSVKNNNLSNKHLLELSKSIEAIENKNSLNKITTVPILDDLNSQYDKILSSLEQSMTSKTSGRDDDSLCEDFDLEEFMTSFDDEVIKQSETKRTCSSTTRIVHTDHIDCNKTEYVSVTPTPQIISNSNQNGLLPVNKSMSLNFSSNNVVGENLFPSSVKRSTSLLDSLQKKGQKMENSARNRQKTDQLEQDIMQSLKDFDKIYETDKKDFNRDVNSNHYTDTVKRAPREKGVRINKKNENASNGNHTPNGKTSSDSAYSSLNRISPSKLSTYNAKDNNGVASLEQIPAESDSSGKEDARSLSSEEFLAMERSAELEDSLHKTVLHPTFKEEEKRTSRPSSRRSSTWRGGGAISSSGSESSLRPAAPAPRPAAPATRPAAPAPRPSRFCHECGERFPVDTAKFCIQCGVKRLIV